jgi:hypothetical protein
MKMKEFISKKCKISIIANKKQLFFIATVQSVTDNHITFLDKYNKLYTFRIKDVFEINEF